MSGCPAWRERILEADLEELGGTGSSELSAHVRACPACRTLAGTVLRTSTELARSLEAAAKHAEVDVDAVLARQELNTEPQTTDLPARPRVGSWLPLAAAALIAGLLALPAPQPPMSTMPPPTLPMPPAVEVPEGRNVVVIPTADPQITVLWFF